MDNVYFRSIGRALESHFVEPDVLNFGEKIKRVECILPGVYLGLVNDSNGDFISADIVFSCDEDVDYKNVFSSNSRKRIHIGKKYYFMTATSSDHVSKFLYSFERDGDVSIYKPLSIYDISPYETRMCSLSDDYYERVGRTTLTEVVDSLKSGDFECFFSKDFKSGLKK